MSILYNGDYNYISMDFFVSYVLSEHKSTLYIQGKVYNLM